ncbi:secretion/DNA translocation related TadE-like protein [Saccharomonospora amisosensis]|uniref:Secretion/DNA translocation related TadE-like protein n=1 Tax=Saccharomonospora amisosensis TaxID=1128677 RepID=A0A7X5ZNV6_9PSEU|nr:Rv3654c family TadE-like protein [Saccharomonospora amisosensis]NIJ10062.1 secretion/DNA translocation related TadE-like protein [Saccharomonospora amisosensis]
MRAGSRPRDGGIATVWAAIAVVGLMVVAYVVWLLGGAMLARHRAGGAADLAALAAAGHADRGVAQACAHARQVTDRMHGALKECRLDGWDALVVVELTPPGPLQPLGLATGRARAGPVDGHDTNG